MPNDPLTLCVTSGKGGVGKTSITINLAISLLKEAKNETGIKVKQELADYFCEIKDIKAEPFLRNELGRVKENEHYSEFITYKSMIINALKYCGTFESIESLYNIKNPQLKRDADEAIAAIQNRIGTGDKGWLSISH